VGAALLLAGCSPDENVTGRWVGKVTLAREGPLHEASVELVLEETDHRLAGTLELRNRNPPPGTVALRRLEIREGLSADGLVFFTATAPLAAGRARVTFSGSVEGDRLSGEVETDVSTTAGEAVVAGHLTARRDGP
jgi:hypothetical protein